MPFPERPIRGRSAAFGTDLLRGFAGALLFAFPLLMTMEMWWLGLYMERARLFLFLLLNFIVLSGLAWFVGFERSVRPRDALLEAGSAYGIAIVASAAALWLFGVLRADMPVGAMAGQVAVQAIPGSLGAVLARKQLGSGGSERDQDRKEEKAGYGGQLFLMLAGALYLSFNVAPTEEMPLIGYMMGPERRFALIGISILVLHGFVYTVGFRGQEPIGDAGFLRTFVSYTLAGYGIALAVSLYVLWTFGRTDGLAASEIATMVVALGFPAAIGAAAARLVV